MSEQSRSVESRVRIACTHFHSVGFRRSSGIITGTRYW